MASPIKKDISEHIMAEEWDSWEVPNHLDGKVVAFEEALPLIIREDSIWGPVREARIHEASDRYAGATRFNRMMKATLAYSDIAYKCGSCHRIIIGRPEPVEEECSEAGPNRGVEYVCRSCKAPIYAMLPEDFGYETE